MSTPQDDSIAEFYTDRPYPPPVDNISIYKRQWLDPALRRSEHALLYPARTHRDRLDVLVAGCGTFQAAHQAVRWPDGSVVGVDVSSTSIRRSEELRVRHGLDNLDLHQLAVERIPELGRSFDLVVCTGVLHHLADPDLGLRALRGVLRPDGVIVVMVYAPYGRTGLTMMREYAHLLGIGASDDDIRALGQSLLAIPTEHPLDATLRRSADTRRLDGLADALLNPRERTYSVPQFLDYIGHNGLEFGRWYRQAPYLPGCGAVADTPHGPLVQTLPSRDQFAAMELFRGTMARHTAVITHIDSGVRSAFGVGPDIARLVPHRRRDTVIVEEGAPPGSSGVLINRSHSYTDLVLPVTAWQKRFVRSIDGQRTVGELLDSRIDEDGIAPFLDALYAYDQVVFGAP